MHGFSVLSFILALGSSQLMAQPKNKKLEFPSPAAAEAYLKAHKACPGCDLRKAEISYLDLRGADLQGANLKGADLNHTDLRGANLRGAILMRADLSTMTLLEGADLRDANMQEANILNVQLKLAKTCGSILPDGSQSPACAVKTKE